MIRAIALCAALAAVPALADELSLPQAARLVSERHSPLDDYDLPVAVFDGAAVPALGFQGEVRRLTYRIDGGAATTLQILAPLREQLLAQGYDILFECRDRGCGGFDFRFAIEVVPAPDMHVDLRNFRFLSATRGGAEALSLLVSVSRTMTHVQVIRVTPVAPA